MKEITDLNHYQKIDENFLFLKDLSPTQNPLIDLEQNLTDKTQQSNPQNHIPKKYKFMI
jgi:hypothetical protein